MVRLFPKEGKITYSYQTQLKPAKELLEQFEQLREILRNFNQNLLQIQTWGTRTKTGSRLVKEPWETVLRAPEILTTQVVEAVAREMAKAHTHYQALLNERSAAAMPTNLLVTSGALGFKVMDPFDWTKEKAIY